MTTEMRTSRGRRLLLVGPLCKKKLVCLDGLSTRVGPTTHPGCRCRMATIKRGHDMGVANACMFMSS